MKEILRKFLEENFEKSITELKVQNPMINSGFGGMVLYHHILNLAKNCKAIENKNNYKNFSLSDSNVDNVIDEVSDKILKKYIEL